ncbi:pilus assembly FimT family protein [Aquabacterium sp.]|uniref:pilus assembly FimT family protein n=1 Tax=Aquabacterium sp. TaxID=1872578 RepID=UPI003D6CEE63
MSEGPTTQAGFTLVEMVMTLVLVGIVSVFVLPRVLDLTMWQLRAHGDEMVAQTLAMGRMALAQRRAIVATIAPTGVTFAYQTSGTVVATVTCPATITSCIAEAATRTVTFNSGNSGSAVTSTGAALTVTVSSGSYSQAYQIESETGLIYPLP